MRMRNFWILLCAESRRSADGGKKSTDCDAGKVCVPRRAAGDFGSRDDRLWRNAVFTRIFGRDTRVETVAHARAAAKYTPDATFLLDIGGQDMKAIWLDNGVITNIVVNEAAHPAVGLFWKILHPPCIFRRGRLLKRHFLRSIRLRSEAAVPSL